MGMDRYLVQGRWQKTRKTARWQRRRKGRAEIGDSWDIITENGQVIVSCRNIRKTDRWREREREREDKEKKRHTLQEAQEQELQLPEQQLQAQGDMVTVVGLKTEVLKEL